MITNWLTNLQAAAATVYGLFLLPGDVLLSQIAVVAPSFAVSLGYDGTQYSDTATVVVASAVWALVAIIIWRVYSLVRDLVRLVVALVMSIYYRVSNFVQGVRTALVCRFRNLLPHRTSLHGTTSQEVELDDLDLAILRAVAAKGPGFAMSAPDLAQIFKVLPSQVQKSLDRLSGNKMLESVVGSTDGYDNYRVSPSGATFAAMWQRKLAAMHTARA